MARRRMIDPNIWTSEDVSKLSLFERLLLIGLFSNADDYGKGRANPAYIRSTVFPYDDIPVTDIENAINNISKHINIIFYEVDGSQYYKFTNWDKWQTVQKPYDSIIPDPVENDSEIIPESVQNDSRPKEKKKRKKNIKEDEEKNDSVDIVNENDPMNFYINNIGPMLPMVADTILNYSKDLPDELLTEGMRIAVAQNARSLKYIEKIWQRWLDAGIKTMDDYRRAEAEWENKKATQNARAPTGLTKKLDFTKYPQHEISVEELESLIEDIGS